MNLLTDLMPARGRKWVYAVASAGLVVYGLFEAADGDWRKFGVSVASALVSALAAANTNPQPPDGRS